MIYARAFLYVGSKYTIKVTLLAIRAVREELRVVRFTACN